MTGFWWRSVTSAAGGDMGRVVRKCCWHNGSLQTAGCLECVYWVQCFCTGESSNVRCVRSQDDTGLEVVKNSE
jgi:hypothetical protein